MSNVRWRSMLPAAFLLAASSCGVQSPPASSSSEPARVTAAGPSQTAILPAPTTRPQMGHWVQDWRIRAIMQSISLSNNPTWPKSLPDDPERTAGTQEVQRGLTDAAALADSLALAAGQLPSVVAARNMSEADRRGFADLAGKLREQSTLLKQHAQSGQVEQVHRTLDAINSTCFECHTRYRDLTGLLDPGRASLERHFDRYALGQASPAQ